MEETQSNIIFRPFLLTLLHYNYNNVDRQTLTWLKFLCYYNCFTRLGEKIGVILASQSLSISNQESFDWPPGEC